LSICVTDKDDPNLAKSWQDLVDGLKAQHLTVVIQPLPSS
jgi:hypothetical protein